MATQASAQVRLKTSSASGTSASSAGTITSGSPGTKVACSTGRLPGVIRWRWSWLSAVWLSFFWKV